MQKRNKKLILEICTLIFGLLFLFPVVWLVMSSFKPSSELFSTPLSLFPHNFTFDNYTQAFQQATFGLYFKNTLFVSVVGTILTVGSSVLCGYGLARYRNYKIVGAVFIIFLSTKMLPTEVIMAPTFQVMMHLGLLNSLWGLILPTFATMTGVFILRNYFMDIPEEIVEAARVDGANEWQLFYKIMMPMAKPAMIMLAIFSFGWRWNDYIWPLIVLNDPSKYTLQLALKNMAGSLNIQWGVLIASSVLTMIPVIILFIIFQRHILGGVATSGGKE